LIIIEYLSQLLMGRCRHLIDQQIHGQGTHQWPTTPFGVFKR
jgi:hypothetical protein